MVSLCLITKQLSFAADEVSKETNEVGERRRNVYNDGKDMQLTDDLVLLQSQLAENEERLADVQQLLQVCAAIILQSI